MKRAHFFRTALLFGFSLLQAIPMPAGDDAPAKEPSAKKVVAGKAEVLKEVPKKFATYLGLSVDPPPQNRVVEREVMLQIEGESEPSTWRVNRDAEIKIHGWWGRLEQLQSGDRVWVWFDIDRQKQPKSVLMLADELSEQDIHNQPHTLQAVDLEQQSAVLKPSVGEPRKLKLARPPKPAAADAFEFAAGMDDLVTRAKTEDPLYIQTAGDALRLVVDRNGFDGLRNKQRSVLHDQWKTRGLPGTVSILHPLGGEMEVLLDHEAIRWGRYLNTGDAVKLGTPQRDGFQPIVATVKHVRPWRERTQLRLVTENSFDQSDLTVGERVHLQVPEPPAEVENSSLPTDLDRPRTREDRIEWFLATVYCSCNVGGDRCTGMFYTQASCNVNACGMPNQIRSMVSELLARNLTDRQILDELQQKRGPLLTTPHLLR